MKNNRNNQKIWILAIVSILVLTTVILGLSSFLFRPKSAAVWPGENWRRSTPEDQGVDSEKVLAMLQLIGLDRSKIESMIIIRNGYIITEYYKSPFSRRTIRPVNSCTKSFTSALIGIAIDKGLISSTNQPVMKYFPDYTHSDPRVFEITIEDLLTMRSGFQWNAWETSFLDPDNDDRIFQGKNFYIRYLLSRPIIVDPGTQYNYNSINSQLLADILHRVTDGQSIEFAKENLLEPLGINSWIWREKSTGSFSGGTSLAMTTEDLARLGYLYLQEGLWEGKRLVSRSWVRRSSYPHAPQGGRGNRQYGFQWMVWDNNCYAAAGSGGQYCFVMPEQKMVIAINSDMLINTQDANYLERIICQKIPWTIASDAPIPPNPDANSALSTYLEKAARPWPLYPEIQEEALSGRWHNMTIEFEENTLGFESMAFTAGYNKLYADLTGFNTKDHFIFDLEGNYNSNIHSFSFDENYYGQADIHEYYRILALNEKLLRYEIILTGYFQLKFTIELAIEGKNVRCTYYINESNSVKASTQTINGKIIR